jgi:amidase
MKIGVVKEGFQQATAEAAVTESVKAAAHRFTSLGASVEEGSRSRCTWSGPGSGFR